MTVKPLIFGTPEHTAWAKNGEQEGVTNERFDELVDELIDLISQGNIDSTKYSNGREKIKESFDLTDERAGRRFY